MSTETTEETAEASSIDELNHDPTLAELTEELKKRDVSDYVKEASFLQEKRNTSYEA